jgi:hypothetical protein
MIQTRPLESVVVALLILSSRSVLAQEVRVIRDEYAVEIQEISLLVRRYVTATGGIAVLVTKDNQVLNRMGYGTVKGKPITRGFLDNGERVGYGIGWQLHCRGDDLVFAEHGGAGSGTTAARNSIRRHSSDRTTVAVFAQEHPHLIRTRRKDLVNEIYKSLPQNSNAFPN